MLNCLQKTNNLLTGVELASKIERLFKMGGVSNAYQQANWLLEHFLSKQYMRFEFLEKDIRIRQLFEAANRIATNEPIQYVIGYTEFMGLRLKVNRYVLIPRPETEILVNETLNLFNNKKDKTLSILDLGTGSGNIAISLTKFFKNCKIVASDIEASALKIADENAKIHELSDRIVFVRSDLFKNLCSYKGFFDCIVSNPPYVDFGNLRDTKSLKFEPRIALDGGKSGLCFYKKILQQAKKYLKSDGNLVLEIGCNQFQKIELLAKNNSFETINIVKDQNQISRVLILKKEE